MKNFNESVRNLKSNAHAFATFFSKETLSREEMKQVRGGDGGGSGFSVPPPPK